ncbi:acyltransferase family protein [Chamaesiphon sp.]|uniref:acyltransferase family protein n=1 Tax=Chamaesiphon sp. TaxID=2814140 RepID=UPI00359362C6
MKQPKLLGIELVRGLSTYAVILVHSGDQTWGLPINPAAIEFRLFFYFAVPFFLATAFYFLTAKPDVIYSARFWRSKVERILIPYVVWSMIFFTFRAFIFSLAHKPERLQLLLQDPLSIIFFGGASYHLYFLPLLLTGTLWVLVIPLLVRWRINTFGLISIAVVSTISYSLLEVSKNGFQLQDFSIAFGSLTTYLKIDIEKYPIVRFSAIETAWAIRCLAYFSIALLLNKLHLTQKLFKSKATVVVALAVLFILSNTLGKRFLPGGLSELIVAFMLLCFGISISGYFSNHKIADLISSIGSCSFGIYLLHPFVMYAVKPILSKVIPQLTESVSIFSMLTLSVSCFAISWVMVAYLTQTKLKTNYLFGV